MMSASERIAPETLIGIAPSVQSSFYDARRRLANWRSYRQTTSQITHLSGFIRGLMRINGDRAIRMPRTAAEDRSIAILGASTMTLAEEPVLVVAEVRALFMPKVFCCSLFTSTAT